MTSHQERQRKALAERLAVLAKQWQAANDQLNANVNAADASGSSFRSNCSIVRLKKSRRNSVPWTPKAPFPLRLRTKVAKAMARQPTRRAISARGVVGRCWWASTNTTIMARTLAVADVTAVRDQLLGSGYDAARVHLLTDATAKPPTRNNVLAALRAVADATNAADLRNTLP